jgi:hypothetical protein
MRAFALITALVLCLIAVPAFAGSVTVTVSEEPGAAGTWTSPYKWQVANTPKVPWPLQ